ncbi:hypothetical protein U1Q18_034640 [Sarracenia purpurea var. burkii]
MISSKKLLKIARKWRKLATISRKRISFPRTKGHFDEGHFVVYTADQRRFVIPLAYLNTELFRELLKMAEEEYGLPSHGGITLPCDAIFMEYAVTLIRKDADRDVEKALDIRCLGYRLSSFLSGSYWT